LDEKTIVTVIEGPKREKVVKEEKVALSDESDLALKLMRREKIRLFWECSGLLSFTILFLRS
jgi:hypothetical protein